MTTTAKLEAKEWLIILEEHETFLEKQLKELKEQIENLKTQLNDHHS